VLVGVALVSLLVACTGSAGPTETTRSPQTTRSRKPPSWGRSRTRSRPACEASWSPKASFSTSASRGYAPVVAASQYSARRCTSATHRMRAPQATTELVTATEHATEPSNHAGQRGAGLWYGAVHGPGAPGCGRYGLAEVASEAGHSRLVPADRRGGPCVRWPRMVPPLPACLTATLRTIQGRGHGESTPPKDRLPPIGV
jgi:hypothetical protein